MADMLEKSEVEEVCSKLQLPEPTPEAIEAGVFGRCADGSLCPNPQEIRSIVEAQVLGLADLAIKIENYTRAERSGRHPTSGKLSRKRETQDVYRHNARQLAHEARTNFVGHLSAYQDAFGCHAAAQLRELVVTLAASTLESDSPTQQQLDLF